MKKDDNILAVHWLNGIPTVYHDGRRIIIHDLREDVSFLELNKIPKKTSYKKDESRKYLASIKIFNEKISNYIANIFKFLVISNLNATIFLTFFLILASSAYIYLNIPDVTVAGPHDWLIGYLSLFLILFWHEIGHAAAARACGIRVDEIGAGIYLIFPAFYTKISLINILDKKSKIKVFFGGMYFQSIALIFFVPLSFYSQFFHKIAILNIVTSLINCLPVLRLDMWRIFGVMKKLELKWFKKISTIIYTFSYFTVFCIFLMTFIRAIKLYFKISYSNFMEVGMNFLILCAILLFGVLSLIKSMRLRGAG